MPSSDHLLRRGNAYHYRRRVPLALVQRMGRKEITFSLRTSDLKEACKKRDVQDVKFNALFERWLASGAPQGLGIKQLSTTELIRIVQEYVDRHDQKSRSRELTDPGLERADVEALRQELDQDRAMLNDNENPNTLQWIFSAGAEALGFPPSELSREHSLFPFLEIMRRGLAELVDRKIHRSEGDFSKGYINELFAPAAKGGCSFEDAAQDYLAEVEENARANGTSRKWVDKQKANIALLVEVVGPHTPLREVDYDQCRRIRGILATIPAHRQKLYPQLELERAIAQGGADQKPRLSPVTQDQYLATLRAVLSLAVKKRQIPINPAADIAPLQRENVRSKDRRIPWTNQQLHDFFNGKFYRQCACQSPDAPYLSDKNGWRFWMPLLALFMGMRANEIAQLHGADIAQTQQGTWYADIVASEEGDEEESGKRLKTEASRRKLPIHPELVAMGFLDYVAVRKAEGARRLFPSLKPDKYGYFSKYALKRLAEKFIPDEITLEDRQSFYSLRHNYRDALRRAEVSADGLKGLGAWSQGRVVSDDYGDIEDPDLQAPNQEKVQYPELDCSFLHVRKRERSE